MPEEFVDKRLAAAAGLGKGISAWVKGQQAAKIKEDAAGAQILKILLPQLFMQKRFETEQKQEWEMFKTKEEREAAEERAKAEQTRLGFGLSLLEFDAKLEDMQAKREEAKRDYEIRRDTLTETERHNAATESLGYLSETVNIMNSMLENMTQLAISGTFADKTTAAENLEKLRQQLSRDADEALDKIRGARETTEAGIERTFKEREAEEKRRHDERMGEIERTFRRGMAGEVRAAETVDKWQASYDAFTINSRLMQSYLKAKTEGDRDTMEALAPEIGTVLDSLYQRWLQLPESERPPLSSLQRMREFTEEHGWIFKRERPAWELIPREEELKPLGPPSPKSSKLFESLVQQLVDDNSVKVSEDQRESLRKLGIDYRELEAEARARQQR